ncbi:MAG: dihydroorotase [Bacteroidetes bacterium]|nr:dihydroorotase [Bacteroidota bacterium]
MERILITGAKIVNENKIFEGNVLIAGERIEEVFPAGSTHSMLEDLENIRLIDGRGKYLIPGVIDDQVHFREPGLTQKGDIHSESRAAVAGGVTSFMDMPNTDPKATTLTILEEKYKLASQKSFANYSFFLGATNDNLEEILNINPSKICGVKVFMGASTGNMLVDDPEMLEKIFQHSKTIVAIHSEDEAIIRKNLAEFKEKYGEDIPVEAHPLIRSEEACYASTKRAVELAQKHNTRLHILHLSTAKELELFRNDLPLDKKRITNEVCVHHLWFDDRDYARLGSKIKWNPAIKTQRDRDGLFSGLLNNSVDIIATDHAPHLAEEKQRPYLSCPSGGPLVQHSLVIMLEFVRQKKISLEKIVEKMCHAPAVLYRIQNRGFIRKGFYADLVLVGPDSPWIVEKENLLYKCGWSPFEGQQFSNKVTHTFVNGNLVFSNGKFDERQKGKRLEFRKSDV